MMKVMTQEIKARSTYLMDKRVSSIYFGGGTPSLLNRDELNSLFEVLHAYFEIPDQAEITLEANPDDVSTDKLKLWSEMGINRLSLGLQSFNDDELAWMKRLHRSRDSERAVKMAQDAGFSNLSVDLIYGSKFQNLRDWEQTLQKVQNLNPQHLSAYNLTIESKTELGVKNRRGIEPYVDEELSREQFLLMRKLLLSSGFGHYEISNFAKTGFLAVHNSSYWKQEPYLGIGPSAHSYNGHSRQWNFSSNARYMRTLEEGKIHFETEILSPLDLYNEYLLTHLRTVWGCDANEIESRFGTSFRTIFEASARLKIGLIKEEKGVYTLTESGMLQADALASDLFVLK